MRRILLFLLIVRSVASLAQADSAKVPFSENGWHLSPHGTIRVLVLYAEVEYDKNPAKDPQPNGAGHWPKGQLPTWKDDVFDPFPSAAPTAMVTRYYHDISMGQYSVLGDHVDRLLVLKESEHPNIGQHTALSAAAVKEANKLGSLRTAHGLGIADFDLWRDGSKPGLPKVNLPDDPHSYDHVMVILRNSSLTHGQGSTDQGSSGKLFGFESDTQSRFGGMNALPFEILKHEFNHLLLGGNNFHCGGGNAAQFQSYFIPLQGGWSMMGAASSSLLTCNGWDRDRLGWRPAGSPHRLTVHAPDGRAINGDLDPMQGDTGVFLLRDFVTTGDVLRIKLPYLPDDEFPQWIWLENHQGWKNNGSPTDRFHYELEMACVAGIVPGIHALLQVDREQKRGDRIFSGDADYLRPLPAGGAHDIHLRGDTVNFKCLWPGPTQPYVVKDKFANPLTGHHDLELPVFDNNGDGSISRKENIVPRIEERNGQEIDAGLFFGHARQVFTPQGARKLGMGTNPSTANALTLVSAPGRDTYGGKKPNNRVVHLNGISVELLEQRADGAIAVRVRNNDTAIDQDVRWCADSIVLHPVAGAEGWSLRLMKGRRITLDRSLTPTRIDKPETVGGTTYFSDPTRLTVLPGARVRIDDRSELALVNGSELHLMPGSILDLAPTARLSADASSRIVVHGDARIKSSPKQVKKLRRKKRLVEI
ncbi:MAG: hypothetical protein JNL05_11940 [Flavobacteriales bacterium]|nr:hypothetical protein [Flavobacteriales bacterium]